MTVDFLVVVEAKDWKLLTTDKLKYRPAERRCIATPTSSRLVECCRCVQLLEPMTGKNNNYLLH